MGGKNNEKRGGARHFAKPYVEPSLLMKTLGDYTQLVMDLGPFENVSKSGAINAKQAFAGRPPEAFPFR